MGLAGEKLPKATAGSCIS